MTDTTASRPARAAALITGLAVLAGGITISFGLVLAAPLGIWLLHRFRRARARRFGAWESWTAAAVSVGIVGLVVVGAFATKLPAGTWGVIRHAADSVNAADANQPPPEWVRRMAPNTAQNVNANVRQSPTVNTAMLVWGFAMAFSFIGMVLGSLGWAGSLLIVFAVSGDWLGRAPASGFAPT